MTSPLNEVPIVKKNWIKKPTWRNISLLVIIVLLYLPVLANPTLVSFLIGGLLVVAGPYAYIRDPLYLGSLLIFTGLSVAAMNWYLLIVVLLGFFIIYLPHKIKVETTRLEELFGEPYVDYKNNVRSILPRLTPYRDTGDRWEFKQIFHNSEHATGLVVLLAWLAFALYL